MFRRPVQQNRRKQTSRTTPTPRILSRPIRRATGLGQIGDRVRTDRDPPPALRAQTPPGSSVAVVPFQHPLPPPGLLAPGAPRRTRIGRPLAIPAAQPFHGRRIVSTHSPWPSLTSLRFPRSRPPPILPQAGSSFPGAIRTSRRRRTATPNNRCRTRSPEPRRRGFENLSVNLDWSRRDRRTSNVGTAVGELLFPSNWLYRSANTVNHS
jgi:hypothetical protein